MKLELPSGLEYGIDAQGKRICTGSQMGRVNRLPLQFAGANAMPIKLRMIKLPLVDGDYDQGGAYWGNVIGTSIYCAWNSISSAMVFVRAKTRTEAKTLVREHFPKAHFFN